MTATGGAPMSPKVWADIVIARVKSSQFGRFASVPRPRFVDPDPCRRWPWRPCVPSVVSTPFSVAAEIERERTLCPSQP